MFDVISSSWVLFGLSSKVVVAGFGCSFPLRQVRLVIALLVTMVARVVEK